MAYKFELFLVTQKKWIIKVKSFKLSFSILYIKLDI